MVGDWGRRGLRSLGKSFCREYGVVIGDGATVGDLEVPKELHRQEAGGR